MACPGRSYTISVGAEVLRTLSRTSRCTSKPPAGCSNEPRRAGLPGALQASGSQLPPLLCSVGLRLTEPERHRVGRAPPLVSHTLPLRQRRGSLLVRVVSSALPAHRYTSALPGLSRSVACASGEFGVASSPVDLGVARSITAFGIRRGVVPAVFLRLRRCPGQVSRAALHTRW